MSKTVLMAAAAAFALTAGGAMAATPVAGVHGAKIVAHVPTFKGLKMLYNQNSNGNGNALVSQNFTSGSFSPTYNAAGADDFVVPSGQTWKIKEVDVSGLYFGGYGPATSENVIFYKNKGGMPGAIKKEIDNIAGTDTTGDGSFDMKLGTTAKLKAGTYWVSVVANKNFIGAPGEWGWAQTSTIHGSQAMWENPDNGFATGCTTWGTVGACLGFSGDFMFDLQGK